MGDIPHKRLISAGVIVDTLLLSAINEAFLSLSSVTLIDFVHQETSVRVSSSENKMIVRKDKAFTAVTGSGETIHITRFKKIRHEYDMRVGVYEVEDDNHFLLDESGRPVNFVQKGNFQIVDGDELIDAVTADPNAF